MKKVLFLIDSLDGGGAEKVLVDIVKNLNSKKYDITVSTIYDRGVYINEIKKYAKYKPLLETLEFGQGFLKNFINKIKKNLRMIFLNKANEKWLYKFLIKDKYDIEIAFLEVLSTKIISGSTNKLSKKYAWVHIDMSKQNWACRFYKNLDDQKRCYSNFNKIVCVSKETKEGFIKEFNISKNVIVQYNPVDNKDIISKSKENLKYFDNDDFKVISIGRLVEQKGYDRLLEVHKKLIEEGLKHKLYILGDGKEKEKLKSFIKKHKLLDTVKLLGFERNPYKYIRNCDLFVCSSRAEGYSLVVAESIILEVPIISTKCSGINELLNNGEFGMLVDNDTESLYSGLKEILTKREKYNYYKEKVKERSNYFNLNNVIKDIELLLDKE
ncbi:glycosyltransferase [Clostridium tarantellae]|uniref:Glycosyltransferase n=1 Tax=Clostridium tarantellae TaxID=39493 RepID=A0A6I1MHT0_9CLOT|nr:glycosyltransferase [Clostridium tarantellae]MPQ42303.1 glycosyltransferase [Clostridium tarantellae]